MRPYCAETEFISHQSYKNIHVLFFAVSSIVIKRTTCVSFSLRINCLFNKGTPTVTKLYVIKESGGSRGGI